MEKVGSNSGFGVTGDAERRHGQRRRTLFAGKIVFNQRSSVLNCVVRNLSDSGACLEIDSTIACPDRFELVIETANVRAEYQVVWRRGKRSGVSRA